MIVKKYLFIFGTRPEAIKLAPLIKALEKNKKVQVLACITGQHREMLTQVLRFFQIKPKYNLKLMRKNQTLSEFTTRALPRLEKVINKYRPDYIVVQGDTTTALCGALAGYYKKIPVMHIEAGLRSSNKYAPYPEELNRKLISHLADYHFAPTKSAVANLKKENIIKNVFITGNTVIDALFSGMKIIKKNLRIYEKYFSFLDMNKKIILVTGHRRESFGKQFEDICLALRDIAAKHSDVQIVYPVHLNPHVRKPVYKILKGIKNVYLLKPLAYPYLLWLLSKCCFVLTDSGGIQEEAPSLGKPVLVLRKVTERSEGIKAGNAKLVGTERGSIGRNVSVLLTNKATYSKMLKVANPYGDGKAVKRILKIMERIYG